MATGKLKEKIDVTGHSLGLSGKKPTLTTVTISLPLGGGQKRK